MPRQQIQVSRMMNRPPSDDHGGGAVRHAVETEQLIAVTAGDLRLVGVDDDVGDDDDPADDQTELGADRPADP